MSFGSGPFGSSPIGGAPVDDEGPVTPPVDLVNVLSGLTPTVSFSKPGMNVYGDALSVLTDGVVPAPRDPDTWDGLRTGWVAVQTAGSPVTGIGNPYVTFEFDLGSPQWVGGFSYVEGFNWRYVADYAQVFSAPLGIDLSGGGPFAIEYFDPVINEWMGKNYQTVEWDPATDYNQRTVYRANMQEWTATFQPRWMSKIRIVMQGSASTNFGPDATIEVSELRAYAAEAPHAKFAIDRVVVEGPTSLIVEFSAAFYTSEYVVSENEMQAGLFSFSNGMNVVGLELLNDQQVRLHVNPPMTGADTITMTVSDALWTNYFQRLEVQTFQFIGIKNAVSIATNKARVSFSANIDLTYGPTLSVNNYSVNNGLSILAVQAGPTSDSLVFTTTTQIPEAAYNLNIVRLRGVSAEQLDNGRTAFVGFVADELPEEGTFNILSLAVTQLNTVDVTFDRDISVDDSPLLFQASRYSVNNGLIVTGVVKLDNETLRLFTTTQVNGLTYLLSIAPNTVYAYYDGLVYSLLQDTGEFIGLGIAEVWTVRSLQARTHCEGRRIDLSWVNPSSPVPQWVRVIRRQKNWAFDLTDAHDTVYNGPVVTSFSDTELQEQKYYYYNVLISTEEDPTPEQFGPFVDENRVQGLSIAVMDSKETYFWAETPEYYRDKDAEPDGGNGYLDKWYSIMGCWLNLMRGQATALKLLNDDDEAPYNTLSAKNLSLGIEPEGFSYDYEIPRRALLSLSNVYKRRGTCEGMIRTVRMFTQWEASCNEFTLGGCGIGGKAFSTWDGQSLTEERTNNDAVYVPYAPMLQRGVLVDFTAGWEAHLWKDGMIIGPLGDIVCVYDNLVDGGASGVVLKNPARVKRVRTSVSAGESYVPLSSLTGLTAGMFVQLQSRTNPAHVELVQINAMVPNTVGFTTVRPLQYGYARNDYLSVQKSMLRWEQVYQGASSVTDGDYQRIAIARENTWVENQWSGYSLMTQTGAVFTIVKNDDNRVWVEAGAPINAGLFSIAKDFEGTSWNDRQPTKTFTMYNGNHSFFFNPLFDLKLRGTQWDPYNRLWQGVGSTLTGAWGAADVGIYITTPVCLTMGRGSAVQGGTFTADAEQPALVPGALKGMFLNPNQNQTRLFEIVDNTATEIIVAEDMSPFMVPGVTYYVLAPRDANRFRALVNRLGAPTREFANMDIDVRVLFSPIDAELEATLEA